MIADHGRAVTFLIGDGVLPGATERGYVLRRVLRRALRHGRLLGMDRPFLGEIAQVVFDTMGEFTPRSWPAASSSCAPSRTEEENFSRTLDARPEPLRADDGELPPEGDVVPGDEAFRLYDTFGLPRDLIDELARERGLTVRLAGLRGGAWPASSSGQPRRRHVQGGRGRAARRSTSKSARSRPSSWATSTAR